jgi:hypothetical protein
MIDIVTVFMNALYATLSTVVLKKLKAQLLSGLSLCRSPLFLFRENFIQNLS